MHRWVGLLIVGTLWAAGCSSSEVSSEEVEALQSEVSSLSDAIDDVQGRLSAAEDEIEELTAGPRMVPATPTTDAADDGARAEPADDLADLDEILLRRTDLPEGWNEDPFVFDLGVTSFGVEPFFFSPCGFTSAPPAERPTAIVETAFAGNPIGSPSIGVAVIRFEDEARLARAVGGLAAETSGCSDTFTDQIGTTTVTDLALTSGTATLAAVSTVVDADDDAGLAGFAGSSHDVQAQVGPYFIVLSHFDERAPDLTVTQAALDAMVERAEALIG
ncbi:MAG: hypothetical protein AAGD18_25605 [Actinomycetota bacterium]